MTDKRQKATKVKCQREESLAKQSIFENILFSRRSIWVLLELVGRWTQHFTKIDQKIRKIGQIYYLEPPWLPDLLYKHWFASSVYGIFTPESQTSLRTKHSQERRARRNGCFRRLGVFIINNIWGDLGVLQSSGNFTVLLLRSIISLKLPSCAVVLSWFCPPPSLPLDVSW